VVRHGREGPEFARWPLFFTPLVCQPARRIATPPSPLTGGTFRYALWVENCLAYSPRVQAFAARLHKKTVGMAGSSPGATRFFAQPFFCAEAWTKRPGSFVSARDALRGCAEILDGLHDDLSVEAFYFTGSLAEIRERESQR
jgi:hypothetical protein